MYSLIYNYLQKEPKARWRVNRMRAIVNLLLKDFPETDRNPQRQTNRFYLFRRKL